MRLLSSALMAWSFEKRISWSLNGRIEFGVLIEGCVRVRIQRALVPESESWRTSIAGPIAAWDTT